MLIEMKVSSLLCDPFTETPIVVLVDASGKHSVPLWVGPNEAAAIAAELEQVRLDRPTTHDLLKSVVSICGAQVKHVEIHDLQKGTYFATIHLLRDGNTVAALDSRPSDAIALAMRTGARIYVTKKVLDKVRRQADRSELPQVVYEAGDKPSGFVVRPAFKWKI